MYWTGVRRELVYILLTLHEWQLPKYADVELDGEQERHVDGYDTFLNQVSKSARVFAVNYGRFSWGVNGTEGCTSVLGHGSITSANFK
jgi:hypothetical protein